MYEQTAVLLYRCRFVLVGLFIAGLFVVFSALVTTFGRHTLIDPTTPLAAENASSVASFNSPNAVTAVAYNFSSGTKRVLMTSGRGLYKTCSAVTRTTSHTGQTFTAVGSGIANGIQSGVASAVHGVGDGVSTVLSKPGTAVKSVAHGEMVSAIIRPTSDSEVPVIDGETSAAILDKLEAQQRAEIAKLLDEQAAANRTLAGAILTGDMLHGGYPAKWDNVRQDSTIDDWGMYNRECVSYAAWKVYQRYGHMPYWGGVGNANQWVRNARNAGIPTGRVPQVGSVAISSAGYYGHAMWVEAVDGGRVYVSQYNYDLRGHYSEMWIDGSTLTYIYFK